MLNLSAMLALSLLNATPAQPETAKAEAAKPEAAKVEAAKVEAAKAEASKEEPVDPSLAGLQQAIVNTRRLNVRAKPAVRYEVIAACAQGDKLLVEELRGDWAMIVPPASAIAWVSASSLAIDAESKTAKATKTAAVHAGPGIEYTHYCAIPEGTELFIKDASRIKVGWVRVAPGPWLRAWVSKDFLKLEATPQTKDEVAAVPPKGANNPAAIAEEILNPSKTGPDITKQVEDAIGRSQAAAAKADELRLREHEMAEKLRELSRANDELQNKLNDFLAKQQAQDPAQLTIIEDELKKKKNELDAQELRLIELRQAIAAAQSEEGPQATKGNTKADDFQLECPPGRKRIIAYLVPVREQDRMLVDAAIATRINGRYYPLHYLRGKFDNINALYERRLEIIGLEKSEAGWSRSIIEMENFRIIDEEIPK